MLLDNKSSSTLLAVNVLILDQKMRDDETLQPQRATSGSAAYDLRACIKDPVSIEAGEVEAISTGIAIHINDPTVCGILAPRSGLGSKHGIVLANLLGVIDSDYTGEIKAHIWNRSNKTFTVEPYTRLCQLLLVKLASADLNYVDDFSSSTERGDGGFGSTGTT